MMKKNKIKVRELDMSEANGYIISEADAIYNAVKEDKLENKKLLYSGLEGKKLETLLKHGTLHPNSNYIFATSKPDEDEFFTADTTPLSCAWERNKPMLAIYDKTKLENIGVNQYKFLDENKKLETLLAVYLLKG